MGEVQQESYVVYQYAIPSEFDVPEGYYLFMGDNRANSMDSRYWQNPYVSGESIQGRASSPFSRSVILASCSKAAFITFRNGAMSK